MQEPFLGSRKRGSPLLFKIPEESPAQDEEVTPILSPPSSMTNNRIIYGESPDRSPIRERSSILLPPSPSLVKDRYIYGESPDRSSILWVDYRYTSDKLNHESESPRLVSPRTPKEFLRDAHSSAFDDSFIDNRVIGSHADIQNYYSDLTRLDFETGAASPKYKSALISDPTKRDPDKQSHSVRVVSDEAITKSADDHHAHVKKQLHRSRTAPAMTVLKFAKSQSHRNSDDAQTSDSWNLVVSQAFIGFLLYIAVGVAIYAWQQDSFSGKTTNRIVDAIYFCIVTMCTIGYGDITPSTPLAKMYACAFVLIGFGLIDVLLSGMVNYVLDRQENLLLSAVASGHYQAAKNLFDVNKGRMRIRMKVALAFGVVIMCIGVGTFVVHFVEKLGWLDSFYLSCMSVTTVGYGDHAFSTMGGRLFASVWLLVSTLAVARSFIYLAEARIDKRHRVLAKVILEKDMTIGDLVAADLDNDGSVSKSDFVVYKLKQMGKIEEKDITEICRQFNRLDSDNSGKITLSCLINS